VFGFLSAGTLMICLRVCQRFYEVGTDDRLWQFILRREFEVGVDRDYDEQDYDTEQDHHGDVKGDPLKDLADQRFNASNNIGFDERTTTKTSGTMAVVHGTFDRPLSNAFTLWS